MDGLDISELDQIDHDVFNGSPIDSDDEDGDFPLPEYIGIDSAVQDDERHRLESEGSRVKKQKTRSESERELELQVLKPNSIRSQILKRTMNDGNNRVESQCPKPDAGPTASKSNTHVMNIVEKAGMAGIDKDKINQIIHEASRGSNFYKRQAQRQEQIHRSIQRMLTKVKQATPEQVASAKITADKLLKELDTQRVFNRVIVHFDLDMFFAAVEIRDNPELADKPVAVGGDSMVSTSNYIARKYGVRAAMPGFIAKKLCPELQLIKPNGSKYRQASSEVFGILEMYDPELHGASLDEAYLDLTDYVKNTLERDGLDHDESYDGTLPRVWWNRANEIVQEIRDAIYEKTKLTCSAGIACNTLLAKISTDMKKPNGQFMVPGFREEIKDFIKITPVSKVSGIGKVSDQFLKALNIDNCGDILDKRHFLPLIYYEINLKFYLRVALGDGSTCIKSEEQRKSKSVERTFQKVSDSLILLDKLDSICEELCNKYLRPYKIRGRTVTLKLKRSTFTTTTRSYSMLVATNDKAVIYTAARLLLLAELKSDPPESSYRLLGVKLSNLADDSLNSNQLTIDAMLRNQELNKPKLNRPENLPEPDQSYVKSCSSPDEDCTSELTTNEGRSDTSGDSVEKLTAQCSAVRATSPTVSSSQKMSLYEKLIVSNKLSTSPKVEPFQCPYCIHGFLSFSILETHVKICPKNRSD